MSLCSSWVPQPQAASCMLQATFDKQECGGGGAARREIGGWVAGGKAKNQAKRTDLQVLLNGREREGKSNPIQATETDVLQPTHTHHFCADLQLINIRDAKKMRRRRMEECKITRQFTQPVDKELKTGCSPCLAWNSPRLTLIVFSGTIRIIHRHIRYQLGY